MFLAPVLMYRLARSTYKEQRPSLTLCEQAGALLTRGGENWDATAGGLGAVLSPFIRSFLLVTLPGGANTMTSAPFLAHNDECHVQASRSPRCKQAPDKLPSIHAKVNSVMILSSNAVKRRFWLILTTVYFIVRWLKSLLVLFSNTESKWFVVCFKIALATNCKYYFVSTVVI